MNAGGVDKACKSSGFRPAANGVVTGRLRTFGSGIIGRKTGQYLIVPFTFECLGKVPAPKDRSARYQLVGSVTDYQGYDA